MEHMKLHGCCCLSLSSFQVDCFMVLGFAVAVAVVFIVAAAHYFILDEHPNLVGFSAEQLYERASHHFSDKDFEECADLFELSCHYRIRNQDRPVPRNT